MSIHRDPVSMTWEQLEKLPEYSATVPTNPRIGYKWRRSRPWYFPVRWWIGECVADPTPRYDTILWREVILIDAHAEACTVLVECDA